MPISCSVNGCTNRHCKDNPRQFFRFPINNNDLLQLWLSAVRRKSFKPSKSSKVCSDHFLETDYLKRPGTYNRRLKPDAVPSVFPFLPGSWRNKIPTEINSRAQAATTVTTNDDNLPKEKILKLDKSTSIELSCIISPSASTQTEDFTATLSPTSDKLSREIKTLKQKLRRRDNMINSLKALIKRLKDETISSEDKGNLLTHHFDETSLDIFENQLDIKQENC